MHGFLKELLNRTSRKKNWQVSCSNKLYYIVIVICLFRKGVTNVLTMLWMTIK